MKNNLLNEINEIKYLISFNRNKILSEQAPTTGGTENATPQQKLGTGPTQPTHNNTEPTQPVQPTQNNNEPTQPLEKGNTPTPTVPNPNAMSASKIEQGGKGDPYQYKFEDDGTTQKYFYAKKGQTDWKQSKSQKSVEAIKKNIFNIN
jgi:hypothetical protein